MMDNKNILVLWNLYEADIFGIFPSVRLIEGVCLIEVSLLYIHGKVSAVNI